MSSTIRKRQVARNFPKEDSIKSKPTNFSNGNNQSKWFAYINYRPTKKTSCHWKEDAWVPGRQSIDQQLPLHSVLWCIIKIDHKLPYHTSRKDSSSHASFWLLNFQWIRFDSLRQRNNHQPISQVNWMCHPIIDIHIRNCMADVYILIYINFRLSSLWKQKLSNICMFTFDFVNFFFFFFQFLWRK